MFVNSMSDLFHPHVEYDFISDVFAVMGEARHHVFQVLTKRPGGAAGWWKRHGQSTFGEWPENVWMGTSVESQKYAPRLSVLRWVPATVRFVSAEPLLEKIDLTRWLEDGTLHWVIAGGESGPRARPMGTSRQITLRALRRSHFGSGPNHGDPGEIIAVPLLLIANRQRPLGRRPIVGCQR